MASLAATAAALLAMTAPATGDVSGTSVDPLFPVPNNEFSGQLATFNSSFGQGTFSATIEWGDGTPPTSGTVGDPVPSEGVFARSVSGAHTYTQTGTFRVTVTVFDPQGAVDSDSNTATVTNCICVSGFPTFGSSVDIGVVSGEVFVKTPASARRARAARAHGAKGTGFAPLVEPREIPVGSELDTTHGTIVVMAATAEPKVLEGGRFYGSVFQILQSRDTGITDLRLRGGSAARCARSARAARRKVSRRVLRELHAQVKGHFRTRGRYSAATVRGTEWTTSDRCDGTLTRVTRGEVLVRDLRARRSIVVTAGRSYLARAR